MKSLLKFTLLSALIISGKLAKQTSSAPVAQAVETQIVPDTSLVFVHQVSSSEPVKPTRQAAQPEQGNQNFVAKMF